MNRGGNPLRGSQITTNVTTKENSYGTKYKMILQNMVKGQRESRAFRNITNLHTGISRVQYEEQGMRKLQRIRESNLSSRSIISNNLTTRQQNNATMVLPESKLKQVKEITKENPQECEEYAEEIDKYLFSIENKYPINPNYMANQEDINTSMRAILVDWLVDVHIRFKLLTETLFLTVNIIDRYLQKEQVNKDSFQLIGVAATLISSKYEEIYPPEVKDFVYITDYAYTKEQVLAAEQKILAALGFNLNIPSSNRFLQRFAKHIASSRKATFLAQYLIELSLSESGMLKYTPSILAASALYLSTKLYNQEPKEIKGYTRESLSKCMNNMVIMLQEAPNGSLQAIRKKFSTVKYMEVAQIKIRKRS